MKGVSEVIAIILILMITISLTGLAYMFMSTTMSDVTSSAGSTVDTTTSSMLTSFTIESIDISKVYVRNTGQNTLTSLSVYVNDELATFNVTPSSIAAGTVGMVTIYSFIPDGATVKVTSPSGFSTSKVATPCERAVGCWKFDEMIGTVVYGSYPHMNNGVLQNGPTWTSGLYDGAVMFDGLDDRVSISNNSAFDGTGSFSVSALVNFRSIATLSNYISIVSKRNSGGVYPGWLLGRQLIGGSTYAPMFMIQDSSGNTVMAYNSSLAPNYQIGVWHYIVGVKDNSTVKFFIDGVLISSVVDTTSSSIINSGNLSIGANYGGYERVNGTIDEVRFYNRAIY